MSPSLVNASNSATWSMTDNVNNAVGTPGSYVNQAFTVDASVFNSSDPNNRYDWNASIPWRNTMTTAPTVLSVFYNNMMICRSGTYPILSDTSLTGIVSSTTAYNYFAVNLNTSRTDVPVGGILWNTTVQAPSGNVTITYGGADPTVGVFTEGVKETMQWYGYSMATGQRLWGPVGNQSAWDYFGGPAYNYVMDQVAYGKLYSVAYGGITYCYDLKTGNLLWTYGNGGYPGNDTTSGFNTPYGNYPIFIQAVGNGIIYEATSEHTIETPLYKGAVAIAVNATSGAEIWRISDYTGEFSTVSYAIADGYSTWFNGYDDQIYTVGRGPSATTVSTPGIGTPIGTSIVVKGTVMDISTGTTQDAPTADFPNGVPVASDASMQAWMGYIYQQMGCPANFTGVPVQVQVTDASGQITNIGTAMTDSSGKFSLTWTPTVAGDYTVTATFAGTNGYWPSYSEDSVTVMSAAATPAPTATSQQAVTPEQLMTDSILVAIAVIIAIAVIGVLILRKH